MGRLTDWLIDWLIDAETDRLTDRLTDWLTCRLAGWLTGWLAGWLTGWLANWLTDWLTGWLTDWLTVWLTDWLTGVRTAYVEWVLRGPSRGKRVPVWCRLLVSNRVTLEQIRAVSHVCIFRARLQKLRETSIMASSFLSVRPFACNNWAPTERIFIKFGIWVFINNLLRKIKVPLQSDNNNPHLTRRPLYIFNNISLSSY